MRRNVTPPRQVRFQFAELRKPKRASDIRKPIIEAQQTHLIKPLPGLLALPRFAADPVISETAQRVSSMIQIDVTDQGPGIPPAARTRIFEPFEQVERPATNRTGGAGLGLAICKGLVEAHGGRIWVQDRTEPGTTISFTLPIVEE